MRSPTTVRVNNNLSTSETSICFRTSNFETTLRVNNNLCANKNISGNNFLNHLFIDNIGNRLVRYARLMLSGDQNVVHLDRLKSSIFQLLIFKNHLRFAVWTQPGNLSWVSLACQLFADFVSQPVWVRMQILGVPLISSITKHKTLITSAKIAFIFVCVNCVGNLSWLSLNIYDDVHIWAIESNFSFVVTNFDTNLSSNLLEVNLLLADSSLAEQHDLK